MYRDVLLDISVALLRRGGKEKFNHFYVIADRVTEAGEHMDIADIDGMLESTEALELLLEAEAVSSICGIKVLSEEERSTVYRSLGLKNIAKYKKMLAKYAPIEQGIQILKDERLEYIKGYRQLRGLLIGLKIVNGILDKNTIEDGRYLWIDIKDNKYTVDESAGKNIRLFHKEVIEPTLLDTASTIKYLINELKYQIRNARIKSAAFMQYLNSCLGELREDQTTITRILKEVKVFEQTGIDIDFRYNNLKDEYIHPEKLEQINTILKKHSK